MRMRKKSLAITLFAVGFCAMVIVAAIAITQNKPVEPNPPWQELPFDKPNQNLANNLYPAYIEKGKWGYIDASGAWAIEPMYEEALDFTGKVAWVKLNGKWGAVDKSGKPVIEINNNKPRDVGDGYMIVVKDNLSSSLYNPDGNKILGIEGGISYLSDGFFAFSRLKMDERLYGYVDIKGNIAVAPVYSKAGAASEGKVIVEDAQGSCLLLNIEDQTTVSLPQGIQFNSLGNDRILMQNDKGIYGYLGTDASVAIDFKYHYAEPFRYKAALVKTANGYGLIDNTGTFLLEAQGYGVYLEGGVYGFAAKEGAALSLYNGKGNLIASEIVDINGWHNNCLAVSTNESSFFIQKGGIKLKSPEWQGTYNWQYKGGDVVKVADTQGFAYYRLDKTPVYSVGWDEAIADTLDLKRIYFNPNGYLRIAYPQIVSNDKNAELAEVFVELNAKLASTACENWEDDYKRKNGTVLYGVESSYTAICAGEVVSVVQQSVVTDYSAEGSTEHRLESLIFNSITGETYRLSDLFVNDYDWRDELLVPALASYKAYCNENKITLKSEVAAALQKRLSRRTPFSVDKEGLTLYIPYSENMEYTAITLKYKDLTAYIDKESNIWNCLNK
jgi:hypothetical protein